MKFFKKMAAVAAAAAVATISMATLSVSAADIPYNSSGTDAYSTDNDGKFFRLNIYNTWGNKVTDINPSGSFEKAVNVTFTISGLQRSYNVDDAGNKTDDYYAYLGGTIGNYSYWGPDGDNSTVENSTVAITGDGTYTVTFNLTGGEEAADTILCLFLQTNINIYQNGVDPATAKDCGITCTVDSITTGEASNGGGDTTPTDGTTTAADNEKKSDETTTAANDNTQNNNNNSNNSSNNNSSSSKSNNNSSNSSTANNATTSQTGDFGIAAVVLGAVATAALGAGAYTITRKKK